MMEVMGVSPLLWAVILRDTRCCVACGVPAAELDHVRPRSRGGRSVPVNLAPLCHECNRAKSDWWPGGVAWHPFPGDEDPARAEAIFEAEIAWLRDRHGEDEILRELWWQYEEEGSL